MTINCGSYTYFSLVDKNYKVKPGPIAVISGLSNEITTKLAELITNDLKNKTTFAVISQEAIKKQFPKYPFDLIDFQISEMEQYNTPWLPEQNKKILRIFQSRLNLQYVLLIWTENFSLSESPTVLRCRVSIYSRLINYPEEKVAGYTSFGMGEGYVKLVRSEEEIVEKFLASISDTVVREILEVTKLKK